MSLLGRMRNALRGIAQSRGTAAMKRALWNKEFASGGWNHIAETQGDFIYAAITRYGAGGSILDLGCGVGATGIELAAGSYRAYTGVDISDVALGEARDKAARAGRSAINQYVQGDIETFLPPAPVEVILLRECLYYVPKGRVAGMLKRLSAHVAPDGAILIRLFDRHAYADYVQIVKGTLRVIEEIPAADSNAVVIACRA